MTRFGRGMRLAVATLLAIPLTFGALSQSVEATTAPFSPITLFDIDGNPNAPVGDFLAPYGPGFTPAPGSYPTTGLYYNQRTIDGGGATGCDIVGDNVIVGGVSVEQGPLWPVTDQPAPNGKTDIDYVDLAAEKVNVNGQINDIVYIGYRKCGGTGTWQTVLFVDDGDGLSLTTGDTDGDRLFQFDFNPSGNSVAVQVSNLAGGAWQTPAALPASTVQGQASGDYGEVALNLTSLGIIGGAGSSECDTANISGQTVTVTGGSFLSAQLKDVLDLPPFVISNCGAINVQKVSQPAGVSSSSAFTYVLNQADAQPTHDASLMVSGVVAPGATTEPLPATVAGYQSINATIGVGNTHSWSQVISAPDYRLDETALPANWQRVSITCTYVNIFASPTDPLPFVTVGTTGYTPNFPIPPSVIQTNAGVQNVAPTNCVITNSTSGIVVEKIGAGTQRDFTFTVNGQRVVVPLNGESAVLPFAPGTSVTIAETLPTADPNVPAWSFDGVECDDAAVTGSDTTSVEVTTVGGSVITCTFTNNQAARINVTKVTDPTTSLDEFDFTVSGLPNINDLSNGETGTTGDIAPGTYTITELVTAATPAWDLTGISCGTPNLATDSTSVTVAAGQIVNCTFTNRQLGSLSVVKTAVGGNATFNFTGDVAGDITTVAGTGTLPTQQVTPGTYSIDENVVATPGYTLTSATCNDGTVRTGNGVDPVVSAGEQVTCTFVNTRNTGSFTLVKDWGDSTSGNTVRLTASADGPAPLDTVPPATATAPVDGTSIQLDTASGQTVTFGEDTFANGAAYNTSLACVQTGTSTPVATGLTVGDLNRSGTYVVGNSPLNVTCTLTNTLKTAGVVLQKVWNDPAGGATATITAAIPARSITNNDTSVSPAAPVIAVDEAVDNSAFVPVLVGDVVTFTESLGAQAANYTTTFACTGAVNQPVKVTDYQYTLAIAAGDAGQQPICQFTNTRKTVSVVLAKDWNNAIVDNAVTISATGSATTPISFGSVAAGNETDTSGTFTVYAGETLTFSETFNVGDPLAYSTTFSCTGTDTATDGILSIPTTVGTTITCTYVNSRRSVNVQVAKDLIPATDNGRFDLSINGIQRVDAAGDDVTSAPVSVFVGDAVTFAELADAASPALVNYTSTFACSNGIVPPINTGTAGGFTVPSSLASNTTVTCTFTNTRKQANLVVTKSWGNSPVGNGAVDLTIGGFVGGNDPGVNSNDGAPANDDDANATIFAGEAVTITELFTAGSAGNYNTSLVCTDTSGNLVNTTGSLTGGFTVAATPTDVTCTFTNVRKQATLTLHKNWINGQAGDEALLTITGQSGQTPATDTSISPNGSLNDVGNTASMTVYAGETITVNEALGAAGAKYDTTLGCSFTDPVVTPDTLNRTGTVAVTAAAGGQSINCTFNNSRKSINLELDKDWMQSPVTGDTVDLTLTGGLFLASPFGSPAEPAVDSNDGDNANDQIATVRAFYGDTITLAELFTVGSADNYDTTLTCGPNNTPNAGTYVVSPATAVADGTVRCTFHNQRKSVTLTLDKAWVNSVTGDTAGLTMNGIADDAATSTAPAVAVAGNTAEITAYAGETVTLSELITSTTASYATGFDCGAEAITYTAGATTGTIAVSPAQADGPSINCTFTNRARRGTIVVNKTVVGVDNGTFNFTGTWLSPTGFNITTTGAGKTGTVTYPDVLIGGYNVSEISPAPLYDGVVLSCVETGAGADNGSTALGLNGTIDLDDGETVTCSYTNTQRAKIIIDKVTLPASSTESFDFTASYDVDGFSLTHAAAVNDSGWIAPGVAYTVNETAETGWDLTSIVCSSNIVGSNNAGNKTGELSLTPAPGEVVTCVYTNTQRASIVIDKVTIPAADPQAFEFEQNWDGNSNAPADFALTHAGTPVSAGFIVPGVPYTVTEALLGGWTLTGLTCTSDVAGDRAVEDQGGRSVVITPAPGETVTCTFTNTKRGAAVVDKDLDLDYTDGAVQVIPVNPLAPNVFQVEYDLTVTTTSFSNEDFIIEDEFDFGVGATIETWEITRTSATGPSPSATWNGGADEPADLVAVTGSITPLAIYTYHVVVTFTVDPAMTLPARDCDPTTAPGGTGTLNTATAITGGIALPPSTACAEIPGPAITVTKTVVGEPAQPEFLGGFNYSVTYDVVVTNAGDGPGSYTLADLPSFGAGVSNVVVSSVPVLPVGAVGIEAGGEDSYVVTVTFTVAPSMTLDERECSTEPGGSGQGTYNLVTVTSQSGTDTGEDCADIPEPNITVTKTATSDTATFLGNEVFSVSYDVVVTNAGDGPGEYTLNDQPDFADNVSVLSISGLPADPVGIEAGGVDSYTVTVTFSITGALPAVAAECADAPGGVNQGAYNLVTVTSQSGADTGEDCADIPMFDLELIKADGGVTGVAGGEPFTYTISVSNVGDRDADLSDPITVTDTLPAGLVWVTVPSNCAVASQLMTCTIDPALLGVGDPAVVISATVLAPAATAAGTYTNVAVVTTEDDPVCVGIGCVPPPCPATGNNNVDCEDTPVTRASGIQIVKVDDVADGATVTPGQSFTYSLVVSNLGPSTILPGLTLSDDLPAQLSLVSVTAGAGWTCNNVDPVACTFAPALEPGTSAPAVSVEVRVSADVTGSSILNVASTTGTADGTTPLTDTDDETTPLALSADLAIIKTSSIDVVGAGGSFDWILTVSNNGPGAASNVVISDTVPGEVTVTSVSSSAFVCSNVGNELTCTRGSLAVGASGTITITVQVKAANTSTSTENIGRVTADTPDPDLTNNSDNDPVTLVVSQPPVVVPPPPPVVLPRTGSNLGGILTSAMWMLLIGGALVLITRSRRQRPV